ncbi:hypothetical protein LZ30DRAFT_713433 [Colletotrichum cereale]|nr:hypothetical protein LZ30DRAFT_713433 [Colletotrichum cereale]
MPGFNQASPPTVLLCIIRWAGKPTFHSTQCEAGLGGQVPTLPPSTINATGIMIQSILISVCLLCRGRPCKPGTEYPT